MVHGNKWARIDVPGRKMSEKRNRWARISKGGATSTTKCSYCGQTRGGHVCFARLRDEFHHLRVDELVAEHETAWARVDTHLASLALAESLRSVSW